MSSQTADQKTIYRCDSGLIERIERDVQNGQMRLWAKVRHVGNLTYFDEKGKPFEEYVTPESIADEKFINNMLFLPVTNEHPEKFLNRRLNDSRAKGITGTQPIVDDDGFLIDFTVFDEQLAKEIENGKRDVSLGYKSLVQFNKDSARLEQLKCEPDHLAVVSEGRAPKATIIYFTRGDSIIWTADKPEQRTDMKKIQIDGSDFEVEDALANAVNDMMKKFSDMEEKYKGAKKSADSVDVLQAKIDELQEKLDSTPSRTAIETEIRAEMQDFFEVLNEIKSVGYEGKTDSIKTAAEARRKFVESERPKFDFTKKSDEYVQARYDSIMELLKQELEKEEQNLVDSEEDEDEDEGGDKDNPATVSGFYRRSRDTAASVSTVSKADAAYVKYKQELENSYKTVSQEQ